jgi:hypothetical protein
MTERTLDHVHISIPIRATGGRERSYPRTTSFSCVAPDRRPHLQTVSNHNQVEAGRRLNPLTGSAIRVLTAGDLEAKLGVVAARSSSEASK